MAKALLYWLGAAIVSVAVFGFGLPYLFWGGANIPGWYLVVDVVSVFIICSGSFLYGLVRYA